MERINRQQVIAGLFSPVRDNLGDRSMIGLHFMHAHQRKKQKFLLYRSQRSLKALGVIPNFDLNTVEK